MKRLIYLICLSAAVFCACNKNTRPDDNKVKETEGTLVVSALSMDEDVVDLTKAAASASGNYSIFILDKDGAVVKKTTYADVKINGYRISLPGGEYTFVARSTEENVPVAAFEHPVYGASEAFTIVSGEETKLGDVTCTLLQAKVTVSYNDDFINSVTGNGLTTVEVTSGYPLEYPLTFNQEDGAVSYEQAAGYFEINSQNTTMVVSFKGSVDGLSGKMVKTFTNIKAREWHSVKFVKKVNLEGTASFQVEVDGVLEDIELLYDSLGEEDIIGEDPNAPQGDGGIKLESTCDFDITQPISVPEVGNDFVLTMKAIVPNKVKKFTVEIDSDNPDFVASVGTVNDGSTTLDLVNPSGGAIAVFTNILPFPYGNDVKGKEEISFDLSEAQVPIRAFSGHHSFIMKVTDEKGCKNDISVILVVE